MELKKSTIRSRIKNGWSKEKAETTPLKKSDYIIRKCKEHGIKYTTVLTRMWNKGFTLEEALTQPTSKYIWNGQPVSKILSKGAYQRLRMRLKLGWTLEEAMTIPALGKGKRKNS